MKVLKLSTYYYPEQIASSHLTNDLEEAYMKAGIDLILHVPTPTRGVSDETRNKYKKIKYEELRNGAIKVYRFRMFKEYKNSILRAIRYFLIQLIQYHKAKNEDNVDVVYCSSTPPTQGILGILISKKLSRKYKKNIPCIFTLQDIFPESLVSTGLCSEKSYVYKIGEKLSEYTYKNVDKIIVISEDFKRILLDKGVSENKIEVIYNWVDENKVINISREENKLFDEYNLDRSKFYISYAGNIGMTQNMDMLLDIAKEIQHIRRIQFLIVGDGVYKSRIIKRIETEKIKNVTMIPFQPYERISEVFSLGNIGLIISKKGVGINSIPSKTWSYMSAETPILASFDRESELCRIIECNKCGLNVDSNDKEGLIRMILYLEENRIHSYGENGRKFLCENLSMQICTKRYVDVIYNTMN